VEIGARHILERATVTECEIGVTAQVPHKRRVALG
jgi:hypothetical protein